MPAVADEIKCTVNPISYMDSTVSSIVIQNITMLEFQTIIISLNPAAPVLSNSQLLFLSNVFPIMLHH